MPDPTAQLAEELLGVARAAAQAGGDVALEWLARRDELTVGEKADPDDLVSQADRDAEAAILAVLTARRPEDAILAEETGRHDGDSGITWAIDPIDGTTSYLYGRPDWSVSVAALDADGAALAGVVAEPRLGRLIHAHAGGGTWVNDRRVAPLTQHDLRRALIEVNFGRRAQKPHVGRLMDALLPRVRDVRRGGSAAAALARVATGAADAAWLPGLQPWDCAAGVILVTEAGGTVGDQNGPTAPCVPASGDVLAAPPALWEPLRELIIGSYPS